jgi:DGQHR domain-containing protein
MAVAEYSDAVVKAMQEPTLGWGTSLPFNPADGVPIPALVVNERLALAALPVGQLLALVPDPIASEKPALRAGDARLDQYGRLREEVQRLVEGAKAKNAIKYGRYLVEGLKGIRPMMTPPITLYHEKLLKTTPLPNGLSIIQVPYADALAAIDGETQRIGWNYAAEEYPPALEVLVPVVIHHGKSLTEARQGFYDLNTREVKPNAAVAISMDTQDPATLITRQVMARSEVIADRVQLRRRQLRKRDPELLTISGLRTGIVTTILGAPGLQVGTRPVELPDDVDMDELTEAVVEVWTSILEVIEDELSLERRGMSVIPAPSIMAGLGVVAHHTMPSSVRDDDVDAWSVEKVLETLEDVNWDRGSGEVVVDDDGEPVLDADGQPTIRGDFPWDGIAGKVTPAARFSIGGPKEVGYQVAEALENPASRGGRRIRTARE